MNQSTAHPHPQDHNQRECRTCHGAKCVLTPSRARFDTHLGAWYPMASTQACPACNGRGWVYA